MTSAESVIAESGAGSPAASRPAPYLGRPLLAAIQFGAQADGVAYVSRLIALAFEEMKLGARTIEIAPRAGSGPSLRERLSFLGRLTLAEASGADWVLFTHLGPARAQRLVPGPWRRPYALFLHGIEAWEPDLSPDRVTAIRSASLRLSNSDYTARRIAAAHPDAGPVHSCPLALHPSDTIGKPGQRGGAVADAGGRSVVIIGRMNSAERYKGHDQLIECWPTVVAKVPDATLVIVGKGDDRERLMRKAADAGLGDRVSFPGFVDDPTRDAMLERAALFAMPSRGEGFGIVYLQAMRLGTPCLGSQADAAGDVIVDGETGRLVDPGDRQALAAAIVPFLLDAQLRDRMGSAGRRRYEQQFTFDRFRDRLGSLLGAAFGNSVEDR